MHRHLNLVVWGATFLPLIVAGCQPPGPGGFSFTTDSLAEPRDRAAEQVADDQHILNESVDKDMDALHERLGQQQQQMPPLAAPAGINSPLTAEETESRLRESVALAEQGELLKALDVFAKNTCDPQKSQPWNQMRAELLTLRYSQEEVSPLAARFCAYALQQNAQSSAAAIRRELIAKWSWAWKLEGTTEALMVPPPEGSGSGKSEVPLFVIQGYSNQDLPMELENVHQWLEFYHFAVFYAPAQQYALSYSVQTRELLGAARVFYLQRQVSGRPEVLQVYDELPSFALAAADVKTHLETTGK